MDEIRDEAATHRNGSGPTLVAVLAPVEDGSVGLEAFLEQEEVAVCGGVAGGVEAITTAGDGGETRRHAGLLGVPRQRWEAASVYRAARWRRRGGGDDDKRAETVSWSERRHSMCGRCGGRHGQRRPRAASSRRTSSAITRPPKEKKRDGAESNQRPWESVTWWRASAPRNEQQPAAARSKLDSSLEEEQALVSIHDHDHHTLILDMSQLPQLLLASLDPNTRKQAEQNLHALSQQPAFLTTLLRLVLDPAQDRPVRLAGSVFFKNVVKNKWDDVRLTCRCVLPTLTVLTTSAHLNRRMHPSHSRTRCPSATTSCRP